MIATSKAFAIRVNAQAEFLEDRETANEVNVSTREHRTRLGSSACLLALLMAVSGCATHNARHIGERRLRMSTPEQVGEATNEEAVVMEFHAYVATYSGRPVDTNRWAYAVVPTGIFDEWMTNAEPYSINFSPGKTPDWSRHRIPLKHTLCHEDTMRLLFLNERAQGALDLGVCTLSDVSWYPRVKDSYVRPFKVRRANEDHYVWFSPYGDVSVSQTWWAVPMQVAVVPLAILFDGATAIIQIPLYSIADSLNEAFMAPRGYNPWKDGP